MGSFWGSFKTSAGIRAGQVISNKVLGNDVASQIEKQEQLRQDTERQLHELKQVDKIEDQILQLSNLAIPKDKDALVDMLNHLAFLLKANKVKVADGNDTNKIHNKYSDTILAKYEQAFDIFRTMYPTDTMVAYFEQRLKGAKKFRFMKKNLMWLIPLLIIATIVILVLIFAE